MQTVHIGPRKKLLDIDIAGLFQYRGLYHMYVKRNIITQYKQTIFGPVWYIVQPIITTLIYFVVFGKMARIPTDSIPKPLFYLCGIAMWNYFSDCLSSCSSIFVTNANVFGKVYFPRLVVPIANCSSNLLRLVIQFGIFVVVYLYFVLFRDFHPALGWEVMAIPLLFVTVGIQAMSLGLVFSSWTIKYRDLTYLLHFLIQLGMYATPVIYPLSFAPAKYQWALCINPLTPLFEAYKYCCFGEGTIIWSSFLLSMAFTVVLLFLSVIVFNRTEQKFMDVV